MSSNLGKFKLDAEKAVLVVIDIQARLVPAMPQDVYLRLRDTVGMLVDGAKLFGVPVVTTEQYPQGIGHTVPELADACDGTVVEKVSFGCCGEPDFLAALKQTGRSQVIVTGMETHVCVYQTVLGLLKMATMSTWFAMPFARVTSWTTSPVSTVPFRPVLWRPPLKRYCSRCSRNRLMISSELYQN